ncbi:hypothetical protein PK98_14655 [Croceibacterium mercuriale]|uniref:Uncharacterized protein n=1 Tax=Croceibacterium mercuriale TaxID=1572751 RepID=A0A0B2BRS2_9SPHN|nr:hypothetical protein [Croceibacterium mercuriale]KHL24223.1 hypothetical protein PK98_14655 [Croceibacterium mercuriale]
MLSFTQLETSVLDAISAENREALPPLSAFLASAVVVRRENTGHGFYTYFESDPANGSLVWPRPIYGPHAYMVGMGEEALMGFLLWCSGDEPSALEGYQYGDSTGETVDLKTIDLADLRFCRLEWDREVKCTKPAL